MAEEKKELQKQKSLLVLKKEREKGVCFISRLPPHLNISKLREILDPYGIDRVFFKPRQQKQKRRDYSEGWVEFQNMKVAKMCALSLNGTSISEKKNSQHADDVWNIKYLPGFKWEDLNEQFNFERKTQQQKMRLEMSQAKKIHDFYQEKIEESLKKKRKTQ